MRPSAIDQPQVEEIWQPQTVSLFRVWRFLLQTWTRLQIPAPTQLEACGDKSDQDVICKIVSDSEKSPNPFVFSNGKGPKADGQWRCKAPPKDNDAWKLVWH